MDRENYNAYARAYGKEHRAEIQAKPRRRWASFKFKAKERSIGLKLTYDEWLSLVWEAHCHYCGEKITTNGGSLDRKDSNVGYELGNVVPCCLSCNRMKNAILTYDEMMYLIPLLQAFRKANNES